MHDFASMDEWVEKLRTSPLLKVVEGKKDIFALQQLGVTNVQELTKPLFQEAEDIALAHKRVILLTDLDKEGKKLYGRLKKDLSHCGVAVDDTFRSYLFETNLTQIEGLCTYLRNNGTLHG